MHTDAHLVRAQWGEYNSRYRLSCAANGSGHVPACGDPVDIVDSLSNGRNPPGRPHSTWSRVIRSQRQIHPAKLIELHPEVASTTAQILDNVPWPADPKITGSTGHQLRKSNRPFTRESISLVAALLADQGIEEANGKPVFACDCCNQRIKPCASALLMPREITAWRVLALRQAERASFTRGDVEAAVALAARLPTQTVRSEEQLDWQQFSTPVDLAAVAVLLAQPQANDIVLEPSAGNGLLVAQLPYVAELQLNEIDQDRRERLRDARRRRGAWNTRPARP